jgi:hypothetical protein
MRAPVLFRMCTCHARIQHHRLHLPHALPALAHAVVLGLELLSPSSCSSCSSCSSSSSSSSETGTSGWR